MGRLIQTKEPTIPGRSPIIDSRIFSRPWYSRSSLSWSDSQKFDPADWSSRISPGGRGPSGSLLIAALCLLKLLRGDCDPPLVVDVIGKPLALEHARDLDQVVRAIPTAGTEVGTLRGGQRPDAQVAQEHQYHDRDGGQPPANRRAPGHHRRRSRCNREPKRPRAKSEDNQVNLPINPPPDDRNRSAYASVRTSRVQRRSGRARR